MFAICALKRNVFLHVFQTCFISSRQNFMFRKRKFYTANYFETVKWKLIKAAACHVNMYIFAKNMKFLRKILFFSFYFFLVNIQLENFVFLFRYFFYMFHIYICAYFPCALTRSLYTNYGFSMTYWRSLSLAIMTLSLHAIYTKMVIIWCLNKKM